MTRRPREPSPVKRLALLAVAMLAVFAVGIALGQAVSDNPQPGRRQTLIRTLRPIPLAPAARETVTVTVQKR